MQPDPASDSTPATAAAPVYASDPDAFTEPWYERRATAYADDARKLVEMVREYEDVHPADAPCLESLLRAVPGISWRGHEVTGTTRDSRAPSQ